MDGELTVSWHALYRFWLSSQFTRKDSHELRVYSRITKWGWKPRQMAFLRRTSDQNFVDRLPCPSMISRDVNFGAV